MIGNKQLLISVATHGDERFSIPVVKQLLKKYNFDWRVNNPEAFDRNVRYVESDMNRIGPGSKKSIVYEERQAFANIEFARKYNQVIDIHGSTSNCGVFLILSDPHWRNVELAKQLDVKNVVLWPSLLSTGPLTQFIPNSLEIECGPMDDPKISKELKRVLKNFLRGKPRQTVQNFYIVTGCLRGDIKKKMRDFEETIYKGEKFTPLLVDQYSGIKCYVLVKLGDTLLNSE